MPAVYQLDIDLAAPVASSSPFIHLDGFLSYAAGIAAVGFDGLQRLDSSDPPRYFADEMPLARYRNETDGQWVWAASAAQVAVPDGADDLSDDGKWNVTRWRKRFDVDLDHQVKRTQVNTTSGPYKSYNAALPYNPADRLTFFFEGDPDAVGDLLDRHVTAVGKKTSQGFGRIRDISVSDTSDTMEHAILHAGKTLRSLPAGVIDGTPVGTIIDQRMVRPPYWHAANQTLAYRPFQDLTDHSLRDTVRREPADTVDPDTVEVVADG
jgi:CRISPR type IV-associated protein Csf3